jgi:hypothetical protein
MRLEKDFFARSVQGGACEAATEGMLASPARPSNSGLW